MKILLKTFLNYLIDENMLDSIYIEFSNEFKNGFFIKTENYFKGSIMYEKKNQYTMNEIKERFGNFEIIDIRKLKNNLLSIAIIGKEVKDNE